MSGEDKKKLEEIARHRKDNLDEIRGRFGEVGGLLLEVQKLITETQDLIVKVGKPAMKCIVCAERAEYMLWGNSYCEKHFKRKGEEMGKVIFEIEKGRK